MTHIDIDDYNDDDDDDDLHRPLTTPPVSLKIMICGRKGRGYNIKLPTSSLKKIVPALRWGLFFLKAGLASQKREIFKEPTFKNGSCSIQDYKGGE